jgi:hypothetical protein
MMRERNIKVREILNLIKEVFLFKNSSSAYVGLSGFKRPSVQTVEISQSKPQKEVKISDLMRRT